jgi:hypothetical protein
VREKPFLNASYGESGAFSRLFSVKERGKRPGRAMIFKKSEKTLA